MKNTLQYILCIVILSLTLQVLAQQNSPHQSNEESKAKLEMVIDKTQQQNNPKKTVIYSNQIERSSTKSLIHIEKRSAPSKPLKKIAVVNNKLSDEEKIQRDLQASQAFIKAAEQVNEKKNTDTEFQKRLKDHQLRIQKLTNFLNQSK